MSLKVNVHPGKLPEFWNKSVVFFANIDSVFFGNEGQLDELEDEVKGIETYSGRLLSVLNIIYGGRPNLLVVEKPPIESIVNYYKDVLKLSLPELLIVEPEVYESLEDENSSADLNEKAQKISEMIQKYPAKFVDGFITDDLLEKWTEKFQKYCLNNSEGSFESNNKLELYYYLLENDLPVLDTLVVSSSKHIEECIGSLVEKGFRKAVVKSQIGASGVGLIPIEIPGNNHNIPDYMFYEGACLIQGWLTKGQDGIEKLYSPSVQLFIDEDSVSLFDITEQILSDDSIHEGNIAIPDYIKQNEPLMSELLRQAEIAAKWLHSKSYRGPGSADFIVVLRDGKYEVYICEVNARFTGATYPSVLSRSFLADGAWMLRNFNLKSSLEGDDLINLLKEKDVLFTPGKSEGLLPINFNLDDKNKVNKGQFLYIADSTVRCIEAMENCINILPFEK